MAAFGYDQGLVKLGVVRIAERVQAGKRTDG